MSRPLFALLLCVVIAVTASRPIDDIKHIVIFMQENRAFDHYFGTLQGIRGFNDRAATPTSHGKNTFFQPIVPENDTTYMLPFHVQSLTTSAMCMDAPTMEFFTNMGIVDHGRYDAWNTAREPGMGMSYFNRTDLPFYYTLYDNFVVGDHYFQSTFTETNPNRMHLFTGSNGLSVGEWPIIYNYEPTPGFTWVTVAELLEDANISWRTYMQQDNFDDNGNAWFKNFQEAKKGTPLYDKGMYRGQDVVHEFTADLAAGKLPQVSWIIAPTALSEHASYHPAAGEDLSARILAVVKSYPEIYKNMAFILDYDEGGQFYDHLWTPIPPMNAPADGFSTVTTVGEKFTLIDENFPIGLGYRVPLIIISPWSRGNIVLSEIFDHTSVIKLIEERFNISCPNISPWRRTTTGNLVRAFDFANPDYSWPTLPNTSAYVSDANYECEHYPAPEVPAVQSFPTQESGVRIARALPYEYEITFDFNNTDLSANIRVTGESTGTFIWYDVRRVASVIPKRYTIESGKSVQDAIPLDPSNYSFGLHAPNGYVRTHKGVSIPSVQVQWQESKTTNAVGFTFLLIDQSSPTADLTITDNAYNLGGPWNMKVTSGAAQAMWVNLNASSNWYDFTVKNSASSWEQRFMGHMENGRDSTSDPAMAAGIKSELYMAHPSEHPLLPDSARQFKRKAGTHKDAMYLKRDEL